MNFVCPKCGLPLVENGISALCPKKHSFDRARAGYYNLLLSASGGTHGDNAQMVEARRAFLDTGAYKPLSDKVSELAAKYIFCGAVLDIGCGEGYYTDAIYRALSGRGVTVSAFDISREACKRAARRNREIELAVARAYKMPVADGSFSGAVNMFSPLAAEEVFRALMPGGIFIMAVPGENHLFGLKREAYKTPYKNELSDTAITGFELIDTAHIEYNLELRTNAEVRSLFMMTPYAYRTPSEDKARVLSLSSLVTEVDFWVFVYKKI